MSVLRSDEAALAAAGCLVLDGEGWHRGVIGILASRVVERMGRPALVIARSPGRPGTRLRPLHSRFPPAGCDHRGRTPPDEPALFDRFGGHAYAVGFSLPSAHVPLLRARLARYASTRLSPGMLQQRLTVDAELTLDALTHPLLNTLRLLEPFGNSNAEPVFLVRSLMLAEEPFLLKERHLKLRLKALTGEACVSCLCWSRAVAWPERLEQLGIGVGSTVDVVCRHPRKQAPSGLVESRWNCVTCDGRTYPKAWNTTSYESGFAASESHIMANRHERTNGR